MLGRARTVHELAPGDAVVAALILTAVNLLSARLLAIDDDGSFYNAVIRHGAHRLARPQDIAEPGVFMLEIDGLSDGSGKRKTGAVAGIALQVVAPRTTPGSAISQ